MKVISLKSERELVFMREAGRIAAAARKLAGGLVTPGITTREIDRAVRKMIEDAGAKPSFLGYNGFPASACISVNEEVIHGIPGERKLREGDLVSIDVGAIYKGYHGDCAATFPCGTVSAEAQRLLDVTEASFFAGLAFAQAGNRLFDISHAVQECAEAAGFSVVRKFEGHGIGTSLHEAPGIPNYGSAGHGPRLLPGMTLAVEPMINAGGYEIRILPDGWTVVTADNSLSAHYENTILITAGAPELLTVEA